MFEQLKEDLLPEWGVTGKFATYYTPTQNGLAEACNKAVADITRTLLYASGVPEEYWDYVARHAAFLRNIRSLNSRRGGKSP